MSPHEFTFKLTVPNDPEGATVVAAMAAHAVDYANIDAAKGAAFVERVRSTAAQALQPGGSSHCVVVFGAAGGSLTVTIGTHNISEMLPS